MRDLVQQHLPGVRVRSVVALGAGLDHRVYAVDGRLLVRFDRRSGADTAEALRRECRLLRFLAGRSPIPVPRPVRCVPEAGVLAWERLPGEPLIDLSLAGRYKRAAPVAAELGGLLASLHALPLDHPVVEDAVVDDTTPQAQLIEAARLFLEIRQHLPPADRAAVQAFLSAPPPAQTSRRALSHHDLGIEHVLVDRAGGRVCGVIDWADAAVVDPARDFGLILRDLGPVAVKTALRAYGFHRRDAVQLVERATFYARCGAIEDLAYGITTGRSRYAEKSLTSLSWLFRTPPDRTRPPSGADS